MKHLPSIADESVPLILCDLPYGVTECPWDRPIPLAPLWEHYRRIVTRRGVIVLFAQQPFATRLAHAGGGLFRYDWIWDKQVATGFANANRMPMRRHENILVFYKRLPGYHPQGLRRVELRERRGDSQVYGKIGSNSYVQRFTGYPRSILAFAREPGALASQKPVALLEYLIRTYTRRGELVLDNAMGTGSTGVAAVNTGRDFIGMEIDRVRFALAKARIAAAQLALLKGAA